MANPPITIGPFDNVPAPGSPIRSDWAQEISTYVHNYLPSPLPFVRGASTIQSIPTVTNTALAFTSATDVTDPGGLIVAGGFQIPANRAGLWIFAVVWEVGSHGSEAEVDLWVARADASRYGQVRPIAHAAKAQRVDGTAVLPCGASETIGMWIFNNNPSAIAVRAGVTATWLGPSPVG